MADFCSQCSKAIFGGDCGDLRGLCEPDQRARVVCECCGEILVDHTGACVSAACDDYHGCPHGRPEEETKMKAERAADLTYGLVAIGCAAFGVLALGACLGALAYRLIAGGP